VARILIIDDDPAVRTATKILLNANQFDVVAVADGKSGVEEIKSGPFDLVLVDLFMPGGMDGLKTNEAIRQIDASIPIITVSGFMFKGQCPTMPNFDAMAAEAGAVATLYKPFRPSELLQAIRTALGVAA
jgi:CheY-like chemotaxis protein